MFQIKKSENGTSHKETSAEESGLAKYIKDFLMYNVSDDSKTVWSESFSQETVGFGSGECPSPTEKLSDAESKKTTKINLSNPVVKWENDDIDVLYHHKYGSRPISEGRKSNFVFYEPMEQVRGVNPNQQSTKKRWFQNKFAWRIKRNIKSSQNNIKLKQNCDSDAKKKKTASGCKTRSSNLIGHDSNLIKENASLKEELKVSDSKISLNPCYVAINRLNCDGESMDVSNNSFNKNKSNTSVEEVYIHNQKCRDCVVSIERNSVLDRLMLPSQGQDIQVCDLCEPRRLFLSKNALRAHILQEHINSVLEVMLSMTASPIEKFTTSTPLPMKSKNQNSRKAVSDLLVNNLTSVKKNVNLKITSNQRQL